MCVSHLCVNDTCYPIVELMYYSHIFQIPDIFGKNIKGFASISSLLSLVDVDYSDAEIVFREWPVTIHHCILAIHSFILAIHHCILAVRSLFSRKISSLKPVQIHRQ